MTSIGLFRRAGESAAFLAVATPVDFVAACGIECDASYEVDWGDGTFLPYTAGRNDVVPTGTITVRSSNPVTWFRFHTNTFSAIDVQQSSTVTSLVYSFLGLSALTSFAINDTSLVTDFRAAWAACAGLTSFPSIDSSSGTVFTSSWINCSGLTSFPALTLSSGVTFDNAWSGCSGLTSFPGITFTSGVNFYNAWNGCSGLTSFPANCLFPVAESFARSWYNCTNLTSFPSYSFSSALNFFSAFQNCISLITVGALGTSTGQRFDQMFMGDSNLTTISAIDTTGVTQYANLMFNGCSSLISPDRTIQNLLTSSTGYDYN